MNVKHRRCAEHGCNTRPAFNWKGEEKGVYCNKHKEKGMVNVDKREICAGGLLPTRMPHVMLPSKCPHLRVLGHSSLARTGSTGCCGDYCHLMTRKSQALRLSYCAAGCSALATGGLMAE